MTSKEIKDSMPFFKVVELCGLRPKNGFIRCPFHKENTPSLRIRPRTGYCYGCGWEGDIFRFYEDYNHCDFPTAFMALGGTYEEHKSKRDIAAEKAIRLKEAAMKRAAERREKERIARALKDTLSNFWDTKEAFYFASFLYPPYSDDWCAFLEEYARAEIEMSLAEEEHLTEYG